MDPCSKLISGREEWGKKPDYSNKYQYRSRIIREDFDWSDDKKLNIPMSDLVIYEAHVRGFTVDSSSNVKYKGTYAGIKE